MTTDTAYTPPGQYKKHTEGSDSRELEFIECGYKRYKDNIKSYTVNSHFYQKMICDGHIKKYAINVYEYSFVEYKDIGYVGPDYRYECELQFRTKEDSYISIQFPVDDMMISDIETKVEDLFKRLDAVPSELSD